MYAASAGNITAIKTLTSAGAKTEARDAVGKTAIFYAAGLDQSKAITALVDAGAVVDAVENTGGGTALMTCISGVGRIDSIKALLRAGADPDKKDRAGISALEAARSRRLSDKIMLLESASTVHSNRPE
jgi:ankyrin repeat protein